MPETSGSTKAIIGLGAVSAPASTVLANYVLDPAVSLTPYYAVILGFGFVFFLLAIGVFFDQKAPFTLKESAWNILSMGIAGFVFVSWARYTSLIWSIIAFVFVFASVLVAVLYKRKDIKSNYKKGKILVYAGFFAALLLPGATIIQNIGQPPVLSLSPLPPQIVFRPPSVEDQNSTITISTTLGSAWNLEISAKADEPNVIFPYLDGKMSPVEFGYLERGRDVNISLVIKTADNIEDGVYDVALNYKYYDWLSKMYNGTQRISVVIDLQPNPTPTPAPTNFDFTIPTNLIVTAFAVVMELVAYAYIAFSKLRSMSSRSSLPRPPPP